jgi:putative tryptophan/tyrosine transport system substrate-binding protein
MGRGEVGAAPPALAAELVALKVDVIVATRALIAVAAKQAIKTIPIVFCAVADPIGSGLVTSPARPGGNVTGFVRPLSGANRQASGAAKQAVPGVSRIAVLWEPGGGGERMDKDMLKRAEVAGQALGCGFNTLRPGVPPIRPGFLGHDRSARGCSDCVAKPLVLQ